MNRQLTAVVGTTVVALLAGGCGALPDETATDDFGTPPGHQGTQGATVAADDATIVTGPRPHGSLLRYYEDFDDVVDNHPVVVIARATDNTWQERPPGSNPAAIEEYEARLPRDGSPVADSFWYLWREFEILEVLHGDYDGATLNQGGFLDHTEAGKTYVLFGGVTGPEDEPWRSEEFITEGIPPYEVKEGGFLASTDADIQRKLPPTLSLDELRELMPAE